MEVLRIDHVHIKSSDIETVADRLEDITDGAFIRDIDYTEDYGEMAAFAPYPLGVELIAVSDSSKKLAQVYEKEPDGLFAISFKVEDMDTRVAEMEELGYPLIEKYGFGPIMEALFDTKAALGFYVELIEYAGDSIVDAYAGGM